MTISYNVQHSPIGAFASLTFGHFHTRGGMNLERGRPGDSNVYIGYQEGGGPLHCLPFFERPEDRRAEFEAGAAPHNLSRDVRLEALAEHQIQRALRWASDQWSAGPLEFTVLTPFFSIPDPKTASDEELKRACCPAVFARLRLDNRAGKAPLRGIVALEDQRYRDLEQSGPGQLRGVANHQHLGFACRPGPGVHSFIEFTPEEGLKHAHRRCFRLGKVGGLLFEVAPGESAEFLIAFAFHKPGVVTTGRECRYFYTRYFPSLEATLEYALENFAFYAEQAALRDAELERAPLNAEQKFMLAHATHSYFGSTEWLDCGGEPLWIVNEGEYEMINTLDLTVDQAFFELRYFPWAVRNELEEFARHYSYYDDLHSPEEPSRLQPGGISFCHDQGVSNQFSPKSESSYETRDLPGVCFSYMTCEELTNWICCAGLYYASTRDMDFLKRYRGILDDCLTSLLRRDDPDPERRNGIMGWDSSRTGTGSEITTYDSLDASLGQARNNLYLAGKCWASYVVLSSLFSVLGETRQEREAHDASLRCAASIVSRFDPALGYIPAVFEGNNQSAIIPAIEALVYPAVMKLPVLGADGPYARFIDVLRRHFHAVFRKGVCQFEDGGWKLSSTSNNSWMSKIAINQYVARAVLGIEFSAEEQEAHDRAHAEWQRRGSGYWACSDQFIDGVAKGSRYYPRIVTTILWLPE